MRGVLFLGLAALVVGGCAGADGAAGASCTAAEIDGVKTISCDDGTAITLQDGVGENGQDGAGCTVTALPDGTTEITCEDGTSAVVNDGEDALCAVTMHEGGTATITCPGQDPLDVVLAQAGPTTIEGSVTIENTADLAKLAGVTEVTGDIKLAGVANVTLDVEKVGGDILNADRIDELNVAAWDNQLETLSLPNLKTIGGTIFLSGSGLTSVELPMLETAYSVEIQMAPNLATLDISSLSTVDKGLYAVETALEGFDAPAIQKVPGDLRVEHNDKMTDFAAPMLESAGRLWLEYNPILVTFDLTGLTTGIDDCMVFGQPKLAACMVDNQLEESCAIYKNDEQMDGCQCDPNDLTSATCN